MQKLLRKLLTALSLLLAFPIPAAAQEAAPDHLKKPLATFLSATGWKNADSLAASARYWPLTEQIFLLRIAAPSTCDKDEDLCLTIIGRLQSGGFVAEAVFYAGGDVQTANNAFALGGADGPSLFFVRLYGKKQGVTAMPAPTGWIVIPSATLDDFKGSKN